MFLTVHGAVGVIIGQTLSNPLLAFLGGLLSHYIFDIIPHGDTKAPPKYKNPIHVGLAAIIDFAFLGSWLIIIFFNIRLSLAILLAVFGAILPDLLQALYFISREKLGINCQKIHSLAHAAISDYFEFNFSLGILLQIIIFLICCFQFMQP